VLAGGPGTRLQRLVRHVQGDPRPKQYARLLGSRSLLRRTLDRIAPAIADERTVIVSVQAHTRYLAEESAAGTLPTVLLQPHDRGTAAGIIFPAMWIHHRDPAATVAVFPSDHFVSAARPFIDHVRDVAAFVDRHPERIVLVGAIAADPETEYGWVEPGETVGHAGATVVRNVTRFIEKPSLEKARECLAAGALWNTFVMVARAATLVDAARQLVPRLHDALAAAVPMVGTSLERSALRRAYATLPDENFARAILEHCAPLLAVSTLEGTTWCDWGSPRRVVRTLRRIGVTPPWLVEAQEAPGT
jgi:mannose-1-phosphate guanylyltransferase